MEQDQNATQQPTANVLTNESKMSMEKPMIIGGVIVVLVIIGAWYSMMQSTGKNVTPALVTEQSQADARAEAGAAAETALATAALSSQSNSDELGTIDADLAATNMGSLGNPSSL